MKSVLLTIIITAWAFSLKAQVGIITTIAGNGMPNHTGDGGPATLAALNNPGSVAVDDSGNVYIAESYSVYIRKVSPDGIITSIVGNGLPGYSGDGGPANQASIGGPQGVCLDQNNNLYIAEGTSRIRKVNSAGVISTVAGNGGYGFSGDGGPAISAELNYPNAVKVDKDGNLYICDYQNHRIRKVDTFGIISTIAGNGTGIYNGDNIPAVSASLNFPTGIALDTLGNLYIADYGNQRVRKVDNSGIITTIAGTGTMGFNGDSILADTAQLWFPVDVALDDTGNIYIADQSNERIRKINPSGMIFTIAGVGPPQNFGGDGASAMLANLARPTGIALDKYNNVYIADKNNLRVRKITYAMSIKVVDKLFSEVDLYPNPTSDRLTISSKVKVRDAVVANAVGRTVLYKSINKEWAELSIAHLQSGIYFLTVTDVNGAKLTKKIIKE